MTQYPLNIDRKDSMHVCMLAYAFYENDTRIMQYTSALVSNGATVDVISLQSDRVIPRFEIIDGVNVHRIQYRKINEKEIITYAIRILNFMIKSIYFMEKLGIKKKYDLIHIHNMPDILVFAALFQKARKIPLILDIHDIFPEFYASKFQIDERGLVFRIFSLMEQYSSRFVDQIIVANHIWNERIANRSSTLKKCSVIRNRPDKNIFSRASLENKELDKFLILYPGSLNSHQGLDIAIHAFSLISNDMPDAEFHIYGEGSARSSLENLVIELNLENKIIYHNFISSQKISAVMSLSDLAIEPKLSKAKFSSEALSTKILEFMCLGIPVIASKTKIHSYYYDDSLIQYYEDDSVYGLAKQILILRNDSKRRNYLIENGLEYAAKNVWNVKSEVYLNLVNHVIEKIHE